jgi:hypothetical protein
MWPVACSDATARGCGLVVSVGGAARMEGGGGGLVLTVTLAGLMTLLLL